MIHTIHPSSLIAVPVKDSGLGCPIPPDCHAVSVSLPTWSAVVGYEEGDARICNQLAIGYPRFKVHVYHEIMTQKLMDDYEEDDGKTTCMVFPTKSSASRCKTFLEFDSSERKVVIKQIENTDYFAIYFDISLKSKAKLFWQHAGEIISSRQSVIALTALGIHAPPIWFNGQALSSIINSSHTETKSRVETITELKDRIIQASGLSKSIDFTSDMRDATVTITVSGMAAIFSTLRLFQAYSGQGLVVVYGFPYLDTLKMMQRKEWNSCGCIFLGHGDENDLEELICLLEYHNRNNDDTDSSKPRIKSLFTEFPSNPLLKCPNLPRLTSLAEEYDFLIAVDDTISSYGNVNLMTGQVKVDVVCSSLTKTFSGVGNVLAGGLTINPCGKHASSLRDIIISKSLEICDLSTEDAFTLEYNSRDFIPRVYRCSFNSLELTRRLLKDPRVKTVYYPGLRSDGNPDPIYHSLLQPSTTSDMMEGPGYGCLLSILLVNENHVPAFFDELEISKGPSLGTNFTLSCPYTLLAHYQELPWAANYGVDKYIIRVSVGLEDIEDIWSRFLHALDTACGPLHE